MLRPSLPAAAGSLPDRLTIPVLRDILIWCESHGVDPRSAPLTEIADFLIALFDKGRTVSTISGYRSAIAAIHTGFADGSRISTAPSLSGLVRAFFLKRPPTRKLLPAWSLPGVLEALGKAPFEPLAEASLRDVTIKTVFCDVQLPPYKPFDFRS